MEILIATLTYVITSALLFFKMNLFDSSLMLLLGIILLVIIFVKTLRKDKDEVRFNLISALTLSILSFQRSHLISAGNLNIIIYLIMFTYLIFYYGRSIFRKSNKILSTHKKTYLLTKSLKYILIRTFTILIIGVIFGLAQAFIKNILLLDSISLNLDNQQISFTYLQFFITFIMTITYTPIVEELIFRDWMYKYLKKYSNLIAYILTSAIFAISHQQFDLQALIIYFVSSIILIKSYEETKVIYVPILCHLFINATALFALFIL